MYCVTIELLKMQHLRFSNFVATMNAYKFKVMSL